MNRNLIKPMTAEFVGTFTLVFTGVSAIHRNPDLLGMALAGLIYGRFLIKESK